MDGWSDEQTDVALSMALVSCGKKFEQTPRNPRTPNNDGQGAALNPRIWITVIAPSAIKTGGKIMQTTIKSDFDAGLPGDWLCCRHSVPQPALPRTAQAVKSRRVMPLN